MSQPLKNPRQVLSLRGIGRHLGQDSDEFDVWVARRNQGTAENFENPSAVGVQFVLLGHDKGILP